MCLRGKFLVVSGVLGSILRLSGVAVRNAGVNWESLSVDFRLPASGANGTLNVREFFSDFPVGRPYPTIVPSPSSLSSSLALRPILPPESIVWRQEMSPIPWWLVLGFKNAGFAQPAMPFRNGAGVRCLSAPWPCAWPVTVIG